METKKGFKEFDRYVLFTHNDLDGLGSAVLVKHILLNQRQIPDENFEIAVCGNFEVGCKMEEIIPFYDPERTLCIFTDIAPEKKTLERMLAEGSIENVMVLDHHATNDWVTGVVSDATIKVAYDDGRPCSGTSLVYDRLFLTEYGEAHERAAKFAELVRQYDTWEWKKEGVQEPKYLNSLCYLYGAGARFIERAMKYLDGSSELIHDLEMEILKAGEEKASENIRRAITELESLGDKAQFITSRGLKGTIKVVGPEGLSEFADAYLNRHPDVDIFVGIEMKYGSMSFRTLKDNINVGGIAKSLGGGGHAKAAGCPISKKVLQAFIQNAVTPVVLM